MIKLFYNGKIYTGEKSQPFCEAIVVSGGTIVASGTNEEMRSAFPFAQRISLDGKPVLPAFTDSHTHFLSHCLQQAQIDLSGLTSVEACLNVIRQKAATTPERTWIKGKGWNQNLWSPAHYPTKEQLDSITRQHPIALDARDFHSLWVNSLALAQAGINEQTVFSGAGEICKNENGQLTGIIKEDARTLVWKIMPEDTAAQRAEVLRNSQTLAHKNGLAGVHCMETMPDFEAYQSLHRDRALQLRVCFYLPIRYLDTMVEAKIKSGFGDAYFRFGGMKIFMDGTLGSQTAHMLEPFENSENYGTEITTQDALDAYVLRAAEYDIACAIHAIGDRANRKVLNAFEKTQGLFPDKKLRQRIEHAQIIHPDDIQRFVRSGTIASMQAIHIPEDIDAANRYWGARARWAYPFRSLLQSGATIALGSDVPIETCNVFEGMTAALCRTRRTSDEVWYPEERMTREEIIYAYTVGAALASGEEHIKGTLSPGKLADFMVLSQDIFSVQPEKIAGTKVQSMVIGGNVVYES